MKFISLMAVGGVFVSGIMILAFAYLWARERGKREILQAQQDQSVADAKLNQEANEDYRRKRINHVQPLRPINAEDPWGGIRKAHLN